MIFLILINHEINASVREAVPMDLSASTESMDEDSPELARGSLEYTLRYDPLSNKLEIEISDDGEEAQDWRNWRRRFPEAQILSIHGLNDEEEYIELANNFNHVRKLDLEGSQVINGDEFIVTYLFKDHVFSNLEELILSNSWIDDDTLIALENVSQNLPKLKSLDLRNNQIGDVNALERAIKAGKFPQLEKVKLDGNELDEAEMHKIENAIRSRRNVYQLELII
jgi:hypothetical protein